MAEPRKHSPSPGRSKSKGLWKGNRVDSRVSKRDLKKKGLPSSARLIGDDETCYLERNDKDVNGLKRKIKLRTPSTPVNWPAPNLGRIVKEFPLRRIRRSGPLCGYVAKILQQKTDESYRVLSHVQDLLKGVVLESEFYYHACSPYLRGCAGKLLVSRKPSIGCSRLILTQILRVRSNFPFERLESVIRMGHETNV